MRLFSAIVTLSLAAFAADTAKPRAQTAAAAASHRGDAEIERAILAKFAKSKVAKNNFRVRVQGGVATIEGATDVVQHKGAATRMAKSAGARSVANNIKVSESARKRASEKLAKVRRATIRTSSDPVP
ncbi:MAG: BON domain-containing protein [Bryobacteraceae bacterium]|nr:BON domain-containing protein [Bryobacteraceae bacterium]